VVVGGKNERKAQRLFNGPIHALLLVYIYDQRSGDRRERTLSRNTPVQSVSGQADDGLFVLSHTYALKERGAAMSPQSHTLSEEQQTRPIEILNRRLADAIDLQLHSRQACRNATGQTFLSLRKLFDKPARGVKTYANLRAEHIVQPGSKTERSALDRSAGYNGRSARTLADLGRHPPGHFTCLRTDELRYGCAPHTDCVRHRQVTLVCRNEPTTRLVSRVHCLTPVFAPLYVLWIVSRYRVGARTIPYEKLVLQVVH